MLPLGRHTDGFQIDRSLKDGLEKVATSCQMGVHFFRVAKCSVSRHAIACVEAQAQAVGAIICHTGCLCELLKSASS